MTRTFSSMIESQRSRIHSQRNPKPADTKPAAKPISNYVFDDEDIAMDNSPPKPKIEPKPATKPTNAPKPAAPKLADDFDDLLGGDDLVKSCFLHRSEISQKNNRNHRSFQIPNQPSLHQFRQRIHLQRSLLLMTYLVMMEMSW